MEKKRGDTTDAEGSQGNGRKEGSAETSGEEIMGAGASEGGRQPCITDYPSKLADTATKQQNRNTEILNADMGDQAEDATRHTQE